MIDPTSQSLAVVPYNNRLEQTISNGKMPLCLNTEDAGYAVVQILDSGNGEKFNNGDLLIVAGNFVKAGASDGSEAKGVARQTFLNIVKAINIYENATDVRVLACGTLWRSSVWVGQRNGNVARLSYALGTQHPELMPDSFVDRQAAIDKDEVAWSNALMKVKVRSIGIVPPK